MASFNGYATDYQRVIIQWEFQDPTIMIQDSLRWPVNYCFIMGLQAGYNGRYRSYHLDRVDNLTPHWRNDVNSARDHANIIEFKQLQLLWDHYGICGDIQGWSYVP